MISPDSTTAPVNPLAQLARPPLLIVGDEHSGANWVADLLSAHPQVAGLSELRLFSGMGLEPPFRDSHWKPERSERMFGRRMGFGQFLAQERVIADLHALADRWLARALSPEHRFLVERSPIGSPGVRAFASLYAEGTVIFVLRDGHAVAQSIIAEQARRWRRTEDAPEPPAPWRMMWTLGNSWAAHVRGLRELATARPVTFQELRYEEIHAHPEDSARALFALCGIPCDDELMKSLLDRVGPPPARSPRPWSRLERVVYRAGAGETLHEAGYSRPPAPGLRVLRQALLGFEKAKQVI